MMETDNVIFSYTRAQALDDGVLIDAPITALAKEAGFKWHCAMTAELFGEINPTADERQAGQDLQGRIWDLLTMFKHAIKRAKLQTSELVFDFSVQRVSGNKFSNELVRVRAHCGPGDTPEPVLTFMQPHQD